MAAASAVLERIINTDDFLSVRYWRPVSRLRERSAPTRCQNASNSQSTADESDEIHQRAVT